MKMEAKRDEVLRENFLTLAKKRVSPLNGPKRGVKGEGNAPKLSLPKYPSEAEDILKNSWTAVKWSKGGSRPARCFS